MALQREANRRNTLAGSSRGKSQAMPDLRPVFVASK
jgi:hypothetical protein